MWPACPHSGVKRQRLGGGAGVSPGEARGKTVQTKGIISGKTPGWSLAQPKTESQKASVVEQMAGTVEGHEGEGNWGAAQVTQRSTSQQRAHLTLRRLRPCLETFLVVTPGGLPQASSEEGGGMLLNILQGTGQAPEPGIFWYKCQQYSG